MIKFTVPGSPVPKGRARAFVRNGKIAHYTPEETARYEDIVRAEANKMMWACVADGPVSVKIKLFIKIPASFNKKKKDEARNGEIRPTSRPDIDNYIKAICDAMNGIVYNDDSQVVKMTAEKYYSELPRAEVEVIQL